MSEQMEFDFHERLLSEGFNDYFKKAFTSPAHELSKRGHELATPTENQKRFNEGKPRMHYALAASDPHIACRLIIGDTYSSQTYELIKAANEFMRDACSVDEFVRAVCDVAEEVTNKCGAELYQQVAEFGEKKYDRGNFLKGAPVCQYLDSWIRHVKAWSEGQVTDPESGCPHLAHAVWNSVEAARWCGHATRDDRLEVSK